MFTASDPQSVTIATPTHSSVLLSLAPPPSAPPEHPYPQHPALPCVLLLTYSAPAAPSLHVWSHPFTPELSLLSASFGPYRRSFLRQPPPPPLPSLPPSPASILSSGWPQSVSATVHDGWFVPPRPPKRPTAAEPEPPVDVEAPAVKPGKPRNRAKHRARRSKATVLDDEAKAPAAAPPPTDEELPELLQALLAELPPFPPLPPPPALPDPSPPPELAAEIAARAASLSSRVSALSKVGASPPSLANQLLSGWLLTASMYVKRELVSG
ncbi:hypothetical protein TeGR_g5450 [Tetraparma gracilis]|uniref:Uncharacterized protein n=1 Tax=Tetraparma gracilis TaxID=2962635 RepID=A0ABQ6M694_9STRA|nr:hypothetical protein TeGR_g5450 [Tetraparma gracilis]